MKKIFLFLVIATSIAILAVAIEGCFLVCGALSFIAACLFGYVMVEKCGNKEGWLFVCSGVFCLIVGIIFMKIPEFMLELELLPSFYPRPYSFFYKLLSTLLFLGGGFFAGFGFKTTQGSKCKKEKIN